MSDGIPKGLKPIQAVPSDDFDDSIQSGENKEVSVVSLSAAEVQTLSTQLMDLINGKAKAAGGFDQTKTIEIADASRTCAVKIAKWEAHLGEDSIDGGNIDMKCSDGHFELQHVFFRSTRFDPENGMQLSPFAEVDRAPGTTVVKHAE